VARYGQLRELTENERAEITRWAHSRTLLASDVFRARLILALAQGMSYQQVVTALGTTKPTIARWKMRFEQRGMEGLEPRHKGGRPRAATGAVQSRVARRVQQKPPDGSTHWSCRKLAGDLGMSHATVQRILAQAKLQPHRLERYMARDDPEFEQKAADTHAAVFCVDEKTPVQALDRLDPVLPLSPGRAEQHGFEYYRHGTLSLYAALEVKTGRVEGRTTARHTSAEFIAFLEQPVAKQNGPSRFISCWTTSRPIRHRRCATSSKHILRCGSISRRPTRPG
jgi:transposase